MFFRFSRDVIYSVPIIVKLMFIYRCPLVIFLYNQFFFLMHSIKLSDIQAFPFSKSLTWHQSTGKGSKKKRWATNLTISHFTIHEALHNVRMNIIIQQHTFNNDELHIYKKKFKKTYIAPLPVVLRSAFRRNYNGIT